MDEPARRPRSPLAELFLAAQSAPPRDSAQAVVEAVPFVGQVSLRGKPDDSAFLDAVQGVLGVDLPIAAGSVTETGAYRAIWLGPDQWLIVTEEGEGPPLVARLTAACEGMFVAATDVSGARIRVRLAGTAAVDILASGCRLDLDQGVFLPGRSAQTPAGNVTAVLHRLSEPADAYDLYVPRSQALSFWRWLEHAGAPYGLRVQA